MGIFVTGKVMIFTFDGKLSFSVDFINRFARLVGYEDSIFNDCFGSVAGECNC